MTSWMPGTYRRTGQRDAHRLRQFAHLEALFFERAREGMLDVGFGEFTQRR